MKLLFNQQHQQEKPLPPVEVKKIYRKIFNSADGIIVMEDLANMSGVYRSSFVRNSSDTTAFLEGHRALFLYICSQIDENPNNNNNIEGVSNYD